MSNDDQFIFQENLLIQKKNYRITPSHVGKNEN